MSYVYVPKNQVKPNENGLGIDFSSDNSGVFTTLIDEYKQATANLKNLLFTRKGERYHNITYGTNLTYILFEPNVSELKEDICNIIVEDVSYWLPYIIITNIDVVTAEDDPNLDHNIKITISYTVNTGDPEFIKQILIYANESGILTVTETAI